MLFLLGGVGISILAIGFIPLLSGITADSKEITEKKREALKELKEAENIRSYQLFLKENSDDVQSLEKLFANSQYPIEFIEFIEAAAADSGFPRDTFVITPGKIAEHKEYLPWSLIPLRINGEGSYAEFIQFLERIENAPYLIEISSISLDRIQSIQQNTLNLDPFAGDPIGIISFSINISIITK